MATVTLRKSAPIRLYLKQSKDIIEVAGEKLIAAMNEQYGRAKRASQRAQEPPMPEKAPEPGDKPAQLRDEIAEIQGEQEDPVPFATGPEL